MTLIESSQEAPIGVGEGTTPTMIPFLHGFLGFEIAEFLAEVQPTWKLGVRLDWGRRGVAPWFFPFAAPAMVDSYVRTGDINHSGLAAALMGASAGLHEIGLPPEGRSLVERLPIAYHIDNTRLLCFLRKMLARHGVVCVDARLVDSIRHPDGSLASVRADDGRAFAFDLFVDCSGFRSALLGSAMGVAFDSYESSLFCDAAMVASAPHRFDMQPFTGADTMDAGWCFSVPQIEDDRRGYVFSTAQLTPDAAAAELRLHCPGIGEPRLVRFRTGRRRRWWHHNVVAVGNSYGFVEPLLATSLHLIAHEAALVVASLDDWRRFRRPAEHLNVHVASIWESIRAVIATHYRYNEQRDTPFWRQVHRETDLGVIGPLIDEAIALGSMATLVERGGTALHLGAARDVDVLLLGMGVVDRDRLGLTMTDAAWDDALAVNTACAARALSATESVELARRHPETFAPTRAEWYQSVLAGLEYRPYERRGRLSMPA